MNLSLKRHVAQVGLQAEEAKKPRPGAGLCPGYTISRAILADAVSLVRGDRFLTTDFTRALLCQTDDYMMITRDFDSFQPDIVGLPRLHA